MDYLKSKNNSSSDITGFKRTTENLKGNLSDILHVMNMSLKNKIIFESDLSNTLNVLRTDLQSLIDNLTSFESVTQFNIGNTTGLKDIKDKILRTFSAITSPIGQITVGFVQIQLLLPVGIATGFVIICLELINSMHIYGSILKDENSELVRQSSGLIDPKNRFHLFAFLGFPFGFFILSILLNLIFISSVDTELREAFLNVGILYSVVIILLYAFGAIFGSYLILNVWIEFGKLGKPQNKGTKPDDEKEKKIEELQKQVHELGQELNRLREIDRLRRQYG